MPQASSVDFTELAFLKQFKLLSFNTFLLGHLPIKDFNIAKLLICYTHYTDITILRKKRLDTFDVNRRIIITGTMPSIYGKLKHRETITLQILSESCVIFLVFLCYCWQIKEYQYPHNPIFTKSVHIKEG